MLSYPQTSRALLAGSLSKASLVIDAMLYGSVSLCGTEDLPKPNCRCQGDEDHFHRIGCPSSQTFSDWSRYLLDGYGLVDGYGLAKTYRFHKIREST